MNTREAANEYQLIHWSKVFRERAAGEKIDAFCERNFISRNQFFYWQRKVREAACTVLQARETESQAVPSGWVECEKVPTVACKQKMSIEIGKFSISIDENFEPELLKKICETLVNLC